MDKEKLFFNFEDNNSKHQELHNKIGYYNEHNLRDKKLLEAINKIIEDNKTNSL